MLALVERSPALALALLREISHRLREFNRQYLREVLQAERLAIVGRFARSIVHDLKNPLNIIGLTAEMAGMERATPEMRQQVGGAHPQAGRADQRPDQRDSRLHPGRRHSDFVLAPTDYGAFVTQLLEELGPEAGLKSVTLELENPPPAVEVFIHPKRLRRVFYNLVHNATDAMPEGGKIILRFQRHREGGGHRNRGQRAGHRAGDCRAIVRGLCHARQSARHRSGPFHLQADHPGPSRLDLGAQRAGAWGGVFVRAAPAEARGRGTRGVT